MYALHPKSRHKRIDVFDIRVAVEFIREHFIEFSEGGLVGRKVVARHLKAFWIVPIFRLPFALKRDVWHSRAKTSAFRGRDDRDFPASHEMRRVSRISWRSRK